METTTQQRTTLTRTESRRQMIKAKRVGWEGTVGDYCAEAGLSERSHGSMVRNYLRGLVENGEAFQSPRKKKNVIYRIRRRPRSKPASLGPHTVELTPRAEFPPVPSQASIVSRLATFLYVGQSLSQDVATVWAALAEAFGAPRTVWRDKAWRTAFGFALVLLQERRVLAYTQTTITVTSAFFADVEPFWTESFRARDYEIGRAHV